jgi:hypothetical protein
MKRNMTRPIAVIGAVVAALLSGSALADTEGRAALLGGPASPEDTVNKVVTIDANTRWANVNQGDTVKFVAGGKTFAWHFETPKFAVNLAEIAPAGTIDRTIYVYVAPNHDSDD